MIIMGPHCCMEGMQYTLQVPRIEPEMGDGDLIRDCLLPRQWTQSNDSQSVFPGPAEHLGTCNSQPQPRRFDYIMGWVFQCLIKSLGDFLMVLKLAQRGKEISPKSQLFEKWSWNWKKKNLFLTAKLAWMCPHTHTPQERLKFKMTSWSSL